MNNAIKKIDNKKTEYLIIKKKIGHAYHEILRVKNNFFNRFVLSILKFDKYADLYIVPEFDGVEGYYYKLG